MESVGKWRPRYYDIAFNLADSMFQGYYASSTQKHQPDLTHVIARAQLMNVDRMLITASTIAESRQYIDWCQQNNTGLGVRFASTVGVHPCLVAREFYKNGTNDLVPTCDELLSELQTMAIHGSRDGSVCAFGEIGLDYDRLEHATVEQQRTIFQKQLQVYVQLPQPRPALFLHMRNACDDFVSTIAPYIKNGHIVCGNGVVHSFTGTQIELEQLLRLGFYIGINGCSLRTQENLNVARMIPVSRLVIESDAPWCEIRPSHAAAEFISPYPNLFYPEISTFKSLFLPNLAPKSKKSGSIKMDSNLPFPLVKNSNFLKHFEMADELIKKLMEKKSSLEGTVQVESRYGPCAAPLIKSRNEPVYIGQVAQVLCALNGIVEAQDVQLFLDAVYQNSLDLFHGGLDE